MPRGLYQSHHTVNVSLKLPFHKTALKSNTAWHVKAKRWKKNREQSKAGKNTDVHYTKIIGHSKIWWKINWDNLVVGEGKGVETYLEILALVPPCNPQCAWTGVYHGGMQAFIQSESRISPNTLAVLEMFSRVRASEMRRWCGNTVCHRSG